jgi:hypothetical protein
MIKRIILGLMICFSFGFAISNSDKNTLEVNEVYLFLSSHVYELENIKEDERKSIKPYSNIWSNGNQWQVVEYRDNPNTGFTSAIYKNETDKKVIVSFAGTTGGENDEQDIKQDLAMIDKKNSFGQFEDTKSTIQDATSLANSLGYDLEFTGHSLGGALAQFAGLETGLKTVTFNTAPYSLSGNVYQLLTNGGKQNTDITNIRAANDYVSALAFAIESIPKIDDIGIKAINGKVIHLNSMKSGHTLAQMIREYDNKYIEQFGQSSNVTIAYQQYSIFIGESANLIISGADNIVETSIIVKDEIKDISSSLIDITVDKSSNLISKVSKSTKSIFGDIKYYSNLMTKDFELNTSLGLTGNLTGLIGNFNSLKLNALNVVEVTEANKLKLTAIVDNLDDNLKFTMQLSKDAIKKLDADIIFYKDNPQMKKLLESAKIKESNRLKEIAKISDDVIALKALNVLGTAISLYSLSQSVNNIVNKVEQNKKATAIDYADVVANVISFTPLGAVGAGLYHIEKEIGNIIDINREINDIYRRTIYDALDIYFRQYHIIANRAFEGREYKPLIYIKERNSVRKLLLYIEKEVREAIMLFGKSETLEIWNDVYSIIDIDKENDIKLKQQHHHNRFYAYFEEREKAKKWKEKLQNIETFDNEFDISQFVNIPTPTPSTLSIKTPQSITINDKSITASNGDEITLSFDDNFYFKDGIDGAKDLDNPYRVIYKSGYDYKTLSATYDDELNGLKFVVDTDQPFEIVKVEYLSSDGEYISIGLPSTWENVILENSNQDNNTINTNSKNIIFEENFNDSTSFTNNWVGVTREGCCGKGNPATYTIEDSKLILTTNGGSDGYMGIGDGSSFYPKGIVLDGNFSLELDVKELLREKTENYKDNSGIGIGLYKSTSLQDGVISIGIQGNYSGYFQGYDYNEYNAHRVSSYNWFTDEYDLNKLYELTFKIERKGDLFSVSYKFKDSNEWITHSKEISNINSVIPVINIGSGDGGGTRKNGKFSAEVSRVSIYSTQEINLSNGLVAHYEFEDNANDSSGNGNNGVEYGGVSYTDGVIGKAGSFDGIDDTINLPLIIDKPNFSYSMYINVNENTTGPVEYEYSNWIITQRDGGSSQIYLRHDTEEYRFLIQETNNIDNVLSSNSKIKYNNWQHVLIVNDKYTTKMYIDGKFESSKEYDGTMKLEEFNNNISGTNWKNGLTGGYLKGQIDDLRIYNRALNESEIQELYELGTTENTQEEESTNGESNTEEPTQTVEEITNYTITPPTIDNIATYYTDLPNGIKYQSDIYFATLKGIVHGYPSTTDNTKREFRPADNISLAETLKMILLSANDIGLIQLPKEEYFYKSYPIWAMPYYTFARNSGAIETNKNDLSVIYPTREQIARLLVMALDLENRLQDFVDIDTIDVFDDEDSFGDEINLRYAKIAKAYGLFMTDIQARPTDTATRGEVASIISRLYMMPTANIDISKTTIEFGEEFDINFIDKKAQKISNDTLVDSSDEVTSRFAINQREQNSTTIDSSNLNIGTNHITAIVSNNGVNNFLSKPITIDYNDKDSDGVQDHLDIWSDDSRYALDNNNNGIPDILDYIYGLEDKSSTDTIVIDGETVNISDIITNGGYTPPIVSLNIPKGWSLVSLNLSDLSTLDDNIKVIWQYTDGKWKAYSNQDSIKALLEENSYEMINDINISNGTWILANEELILPINKNSDTTYSYNNNWTLNGTNKNIESNTLECKNGKSPYTVWKYKNSTNKWSIYSSQIENFTSYTIYTNEGFWVDCR